MIKYHKNIVIIASLLAMLTIVMGAFGAHGLKSLISPDSLAVFQTGVTYQMYHALALLALALIPGLEIKKVKGVFRFFVFGTFFFSGSLYFLALKSVLPFSVSFLAPVTPVGGLLLILGWALLAYSVAKMK
jgi:uncharacterized membrane protein YgdD (TMEM256/DUF423 family)|tara:strand:- start:658 stop:1050 length:393 start_codon:yes stop_codon:yes gene_type:complete